MEAKRRFLRRSQGIPPATGRLQQRIGAHDIGLDKRRRAVNRTIDMAFPPPGASPYPVDADEKCDPARRGRRYPPVQRRNAHPAPPAPATLNCRRRSVYPPPPRDRRCWIISRTTAEPMKPAPPVTRMVLTATLAGVDDKRLGDAIAANGFKLVMIDQHHQHIGAGQRRLKGRQRTQSIEFLRQRVNVGLNHTGSCRCASGQSARQFPSPDFRAGRQYSV